MTKQEFITYRVLKAPPCGALAEVLDADKAWKKMEELCDIGKPLDPGPEKS